MKATLTKYRDDNGKRIRVGDLILHGMLGQLWLVRSKTRVRIVSGGTGLGYEDRLDGIGIGEKNGKKFANGTRIVGSVLREYEYKNER